MPSSTASERSRCASAPHLDADWKTLGQPGDHGLGAVFRSVVDEQQLPREAAAGKRGADALDQIGNVLYLTVCRDYNRNRSGGRDRSGPSARVSAIHHRTEPRSMRAHPGGRPTRFRRSPSRLNWNV